MRGTGCRRVFKVLSWCCPYTQTVSITLQPLPTQMGNQLYPIIEQIRNVSDARIDCSIAQPRPILLEHLHRHWPYWTPDTFELILENGARYIKEIEAWVKPFSLPQDYRDFLAFYGGMLLSDDETYHLIMDGVGPMVEEWYGSLMGDDGEFRDGLLRIGFQEVYDSSGPGALFWLDLAGSIQKEAVFYTLRTSPDKSWQFLAPSFLEFLTIISNGDLPITLR